MTQLRVIWSLITQLLSMWSLITRNCWHCGASSRATAGTVEPHHAQLLVMWSLITRNCWHCGASSRATAGTVEPHHAQLLAMWSLITRNCWHCGASSRISWHFGVEPHHLFLSCKVSLWMRSELVVYPLITGPHSCSCAMQQAPPQKKKILYGMRRMLTLTGTCKNKRSNY